MNYILYHNYVSRVHTVLTVWGIETSPLAYCIIFKSEYLNDFSNLLLSISHISKSPLNLLPLIKPILLSGNSILSQTENPKTFPDGSFFSLLIPLVYWYLPLEIQTLLIIVSKGSIFLGLHIAIASKQ